MIVNMSLSDYYVISTLQDLPHLVVYLTTVNISVCFPSVFLYMIHKSFQQLCKPFTCFLIIILPTIIAYNPHNKLVRYLFSLQFYRWNR